MRYIGFSLTLVFLATFVKETVASSPGAVSARLLVVANETRQIEPNGERFAFGSTVSRGTLLAAIDTKAFKIQGRGVSKFIHVRHLAGGEHAEGWIAQRDLVRFTALSRDSSQPGLAGNANELRELPALLRFQPAGVRRAWRDVHMALEDNKTLQQPLPEPYFARAEIWMLVNNFDAALRDYLTAAQLAESSGVSLTAFAAYFSRLREALEGLDEVPRPAVLGAPSKHYASGLHEFWAGNLQLALRHFENAVQLEPNRPLYWYYRALTYKRLGQDDRAQHDALIGAHVEWRDGSRDRLGWGFVRLQGDLRQWVEQYRQGDPTQQIIGNTLATR